MAMTHGCTVKGISSSRCHAAVARALQAVVGVTSAVVDLQRAEATVTFDPVRVAPRDPVAAVEDAGYPSAPA